MAAVATAFGFVIGTATLVLALLNIREKLWPKPVTPHLLEPVLREIAAAIRRGPTE